MYIVRETLDDVLLALYPELLARRHDEVHASRGKTAEAVGVLLEITNSRARLSRSETRGKLFSSLGELLWYLTRDRRLDFIERYIPHYRQESEDGITVYGGYGPRLFALRGHDQIRNVIELLANRPTSRRAVIQIFDAEDIAEPHREVPCTTTLQFFVRNECLDMVTTMRSNDAYLGLPHDVFCFTMLQELIARSLDREVGVYRHFAGSLHIYGDHWEDAQRFVDEAYQQRVSMPKMPEGDPWPAVELVLKAENDVRNGRSINAAKLGLDEYWADLVRIIQIHFGEKGDQKIAKIAEQIVFKKFKQYIVGRITAAHGN